MQRAVVYLMPEAVLSLRDIRALSLVLFIAINIALTDASSAAQTTDIIASQTSDFLQHKRLFFDTHERSSPSSFSEIPETGTERERRMEIEPQKSSVRMEKNVNLKDTGDSLTPIPLNYEGHIESVTALSIIVNGQLCVSLVLINENPLNTTEREVDCPHLIFADVKLILLSDSHSLQVIKAHKLVGVVRPGQSL